MIMRFWILNLGMKGLNLPRGKETAIRHKLDTVHVVKLFFTLKLHFLHQDFSNTRTRTIQNIKDAHQMYKKREKKKVAANVTPFI